MKKGLLVALVFFTVVSSADAQQSCSQRLNQAEDYFDQGRLLEIEQLIKGCLTDGSFTEAEAIRARKLLVKVAIFTDNEPKAEEEFIELLLLDPVHKLQPEDPSELRVLRSKFRTFPVFRIEGKFGLNVSVPSVNQSYSVWPVSDGSEKTYGSPFPMGFQFEAGVSRHIKSGVEVGAGIQFRNSKYTVQSDPSSVNDGGFTTEIANSQTALRLPLFLRYNFNYSYLGERQFTPFVFAGFSVDYYLKAQYSEASRSGGTAVTISGNEADLKSYGQINEFNTSIFFGVGTKITMKKGNFFLAEIRYDRSLSLYNVPLERYSNPKIHGDLMFVEDDVYLNFISINVGYVRSIFKPQKLEK